MAVTIKKLLSLLEGERKKLPLMVALFLVLSVTDIVGIGLVIPVIHFVIFGELNFDLLEQLQLTAAARLLSGHSPSTICALIIIVFLLRLIIVVLTNISISRFSQNQRLRLANNLMTTYLEQGYLDLSWSARW